MAEAGKDLSVPTVKENGTPKGGPRRKGLGHGSYAAIGNIPCPRALQEGKFFLKQGFCVSPFLPFDDAPAKGEDAVGPKGRDDDDSRLVGMGESRFIIP